MPTSNEAQSTDGAVLRGKAVEMFATFEASIDGILARYYAPKHPRSTYFYLDLLASENCSFALRRDALESIARRHGCYEDSRMKSVRQANRWRNFLAHAALELHDYDNNEPVPKIGIRDPKHPHKPIPLTNAFEKFEVEVRSAKAYVTDIYDKLFPEDRFGNRSDVLDGLLWSPSVPTK